MEYIFHIIEKAEVMDHCVEEAGFISRVFNAGSCPCEFDDKGVTVFFRKSLVAMRKVVRRYSDACEVLEVSQSIPRLFRAHRRGYYRCSFLIGKAPSFKLVALKKFQTTFQVCGRHS